MNLECTKCGYKLKKESIPRQCPYCSEEGGMREAKNAQDLIDETMFETGVMARERDARQ